MRSIVAVGSEIGISDARQWERGACQLPTTGAPARTHTSTDQARTTNEPERERARERGFYELERAAGGEGTMCQAKECCVARSKLYDAKPTEHAQNHSIFAALPTQTRVRPLTVNTTGATIVLFQDVLLQRQQRTRHWKAVPVDPVLPPFTVLCGESRVVSPHFHPSRSRCKVSERRRVYDVRVCTHDLLVCQITTFL
jgi:hypothetical protein